MKHSLFLLSLVLVLILLPASAVAQSAAPPVNVASFANPSLPNGKIAQGSMFEIFGSGIAAAGLNRPPGFPLETVLAGTSVRINVGGEAIDCLVVRTLSNDRVAAILPSTAPLGGGTLTVTFNGQTTAPVPIEVVAHSFGIFTLNSAGSGPGVLTAPLKRNTINTLLTSFQPGELVDVWGTGLGAVPFSDALVPQLKDLPIDVQVTVGGVPATVAFRGRDAGGCCAAIDIVRFTIPAGVEGCYVPLSIVVNGVPSNFASISISSSGSACSEPGGLLRQTLTKAQTSGSTALGDINLSRLSLSTVGLPGVPSQSLDINIDSISATYLRFTYDELIRYSGVSEVSTIGACMVFQISAQEASANDPIADRVQGLDAGTVTISGPTGTDTLTQDPMGHYSKKLNAMFLLMTNPKGLLEAKEQFGLPGFLGPGTYVANASGGSGVGAHTASIVVPRPPTTNLDAISEVVRAQGLRLTFSGAENADYVMVMGFSSSKVGENDTSGAAFFCRARPGNGSFDVPQAVLASLPPSVEVDGVPAGALMMGIGSSESFAASGMDQGVISQQDLRMRVIAYR